MNNDQSGIVTFEGDESGVGNLALDGEGGNGVEPEYLGPVVIYAHSIYGWTFTIYGNNITIYGA